MVAFYSSAALAVTPASVLGIRRTSGTVTAEVIIQWFMELSSLGFCWKEFFIRA